MRYFNADMLVLARESRGLAQNKLSEILSIKQYFLSRIESKLNIPNDELIQKISTELDYPVEFFYQHGYKYPVKSFHRKKKKLSQTDLAQITAIANIVILNTRTLLNDISLAKFGVEEIDDYDSPEQVAKQIRSAWSIPVGPIDDVITCIERNGGIVMEIDTLTDLFDGVTITAPELPQFIFFNKQMPGDRIRFTLAHELGHAIMHRFLSDTMEIEANRFASEFLMPENEIKQHLYNLSIPKLVELKIFWRVSMQSLIERAKYLKTITDTEYKVLYKQMAYRRMIRNEPYPLEREKPKLVSGIINFLKREMNYDDNDIMKRMFINEIDYFGKYTNKPIRSKPKLVKRVDELLDYNSNPDTI